ncbi:hypothetical protein FRC08_008857, partial [Ceratobasidium sp. 394]
RTPTTSIRRKKSEQPRDSLGHFVRNAPEQPSFTWLTPPDSGLSRSPIRPVFVPEGFVTEAATPAPAVVSDADSPFAFIPSELPTVPNTPSPSRRDARPLPPLRPASCASTDQLEDELTEALAVVEDDDEPIPEPISHQPAAAIPTASATVLPTAVTPSTAPHMAGNSASTAPHPDWRLGFLSCARTRPSTPETHVQV